MLLLPTLPCAIPKHAIKRLVVMGSMALLQSACTEAPTWQRLLTLKITEQYPDYKAQTTATGSLLVERPGKSSLPFDAEAIGQFCRRGPKDCNYATDQMLLELGGE